VPTDKLIPANNKAKLTSTRARVELLERGQKLLPLRLLTNVMLDEMSVRMKVAPNTRIR
jgi:hypothetical protein